MFQWKNFENRSIFGEDMDKSMWLSFFGPPCILDCLLWGSMVGYPSDSLASCWMWWTFGSKNSDNTVRCCRLVINSKLIRERNVWIHQFWIRVQPRIWSNDPHSHPQTCAGLVLDSASTSRSHDLGWLVGWREAEIFTEYRHRLVKTQDTQVTPDKMLLAGS